MSFEDLAWARRQRVGRVGPKAVLICLASYTDDDHTCYPGQATIAEATDQGERTVRRQLVELEAAGFILRNARSAGNGRGRRTDFYTLLVASDLQPAKLAGDLQPASDDIQPASGALTTGQALAGELEVNTQIGRPVTNKGRATKLPEPFIITPAMSKWAARFVGSISIPAETRAFFDYHRARDSRFVDWSAAWRTWMRNAVKFSQRQGRQLRSAPSVEKPPTWDRNDPGGEIQL